MKHGVHMYMTIHHLSSSACLLRLFVDCNEHGSVMCEWCVRDQLFYSSDCIAESKMTSCLIVDRGS